MKKMGMSRLKRFKLKDIRSWYPCIDPGQFVRPPQSTLTALVVLQLQGPSDSDKLWTVLRSEVLPDRILRLFAIGIAKRALLAERKRGREPHKDSWNILKVSRRFVDGKATPKELEAAAWAAEEAAKGAGSAAWAARWAAWAAAWAATDAAWAAARAVWAATDAAARAATDAAEKRAQIKLLLRIIRREGYK